MLRLTFQSATPIPIEVMGLTPENLAGKSADEVARVPLQHGNVRVAVGEFFAVAGSADDGEMRIEGDCAQVKYLGAGMRSGRITVQGDVGMHLGAGMLGGEIRLHGRAGDWLGAEMRGGLIHVRGDAGHWVGAAYPGSRAGMRGGAILVQGRVGDEAGSTLRRGFIAVGSAGDFTGASMIAGTVFVFGPAGIRAGAGMKRGTIAFFGSLPALLPTFRFCCLYQPVFMQLYLRQLQAWGYPVRENHLRGSYRRYGGDLVALGEGEVLHWQAP